MATSNFSITEGSGKNIATNNITEDSITKQLQRVVLNDTTGAERGSSANPINIDLSKVNGTTFSTSTSFADGESNTQTAMPTESYLMNFNGTTWDRVRGDIANGMDVDVTRLPALPTGTNAIGSVGLTRKATYRAAISALVAPAGTAPFFNITGSGTKTIIVQRIIVSGATLTAVAYLNYECRKLSTASTGGTSTSPTVVPVDSSSAAGTAVVKAYTVAPTSGTLVGIISTKRTLGQATTAAAAGSPDVIEFDFRPMEGTGIYLRGATQELAMAFGTAPATAVTLSAIVEWTEE